MMKRLGVVLLALAAVSVSVTAQEDPFANSGEWTLYDLNSFSGAPRIVFDDPAGQILVRERGTWTFRDGFRIKDLDDGAELREPYTYRADSRTLAVRSERYWLLPVSESVFLVYRLLDVEDGLTAGPPGMVKARFLLAKGGLPEVYITAAERED